jgi:hypothetical protein
VTDKPAAHDLGSFEDVFAELARAGLRPTVIGGCAVGAYASAHNVAVLSADLDIYVSHADMDKLRAGLAALPHVRVTASPQPRSLQTLVLDWDGREVDALVASDGPLPSAEKAYSSAWVFLEGIHVLEPFALLENKRALKRDKDKPHVDIMTQACREIVYGKFRRDDPSFVKPFLQATGLSLLPADLFELLLPEGDARCRKVLVQYAPSREAAQLVVAGAPEGEREVLAQILRARRV